jgi:hypothetical protein
MGKLGKQRKKLRLLRQQNVLQGVSSSKESHSDGSSSDEDANQAPTSIVNNGPTSKISESDMAATLRTLHTLSQDLELFRSPSIRMLRAAIQPLVEEQIKRSKMGKESVPAGQVSGKKRTKDPGPPEIRDSEESSAKIRFGSKVCRPMLSTCRLLDRREQVCEALRDKRWSDALTAIEGMRRQREVLSPIGTRVARGASRMYSTASHPLAPT